MIKKIRELEKIAIQLEPEAQQRKSMRDQVVNYTEKFLDNLDGMKTYESSEGLGKGLLDSPIVDKPADMSDLINLVDKNVDHEGINPASGKHFGYIPGGGLYASSLGDYWADITNRYSGIFYADPGSVRMENQLIRWMAEMIGYPKEAYGNLASGGSIANLIAVVTAREAHKIKPHHIANSVVYLSDHAHHCIKKSLKIAGLGDVVVRKLPLDEKFRVKPEDLKALIENDLKKGLKPWLVAGSAGTTDVGAIDPLEKMSEISKEFGLWFHVDAAYGGYFMLCDGTREKFKGIEASDSVVVDPHKGLFLPYGLGVCLIREGYKMKEAFTESANYMQDAFESEEEVSPADVSPELTKHFRGLRLWLPLKLHGVAPFRASLEEKLLLTQYFYQEIQKIPGFEVGPEPELSVVTYWYVPSSGDINAFNQALIKEIHKDGRVFISSTMIDGRFTLRLAVLVFRSHLEEVDLTIQILKEKVAELDH